MMLVHDECSANVAAYIHAYFFIKLMHGKEKSWHPISIFYLT